MGAKVMAGIINLRALSAGGFCASQGLVSLRLRSAYGGNYGGTEKFYHFYRKISIPEAVLNPRPQKHP
jgi:hypothetical protein